MLLDNNQKIELMKIASTIDMLAGEGSGTRENTVKAYKEFVNLIEDRPHAVTLSPTGEIIKTAGEISVIDKEGFRQLREALSKENNYTTNTRARLIQEHAIYKQFFKDLQERPQNPVEFSSYWKAKAFDALDRIQKLSFNIPYYDPAWENADKVLFTFNVSKSNA